MAVIREEAPAAAHTMTSREALLRQRRQLLIELSIKRRRLQQSIAKTDGVEEATRCWTESDTRSRDSSAAQEDDRSEYNTTTGRIQTVTDDGDDPPAKACDRAECVDYSSGPSDRGNYSLQAKAVLKFENKVRAVKLSASSIFILTDMIADYERESRKLFKWYTALYWDLRDVPVLKESFGVCLACTSPQSRFSKDRNNLYSLEESGLAVSPDNSIMSFIGCFQLNPRGELAPRAIHNPDRSGLEASAQSFGSKSSQHYSTLTLRTREKADDIHVACPLVPTCSAFVDSDKLFVGGEDGKLCMVDIRTGLQPVSFPQATFHQIPISFLRKLVYKFEKVYALDGNGAVAVWDSVNQSLLSIHDIAPVPLADDEVSSESCKIPVFAGVMIRNYQESSASQSMSQAENFTQTISESGGGKRGLHVAANCQSGYYFAVALFMSNSAKVAVSSVSTSLPIAWSAQTDQVSHSLRLQVISEEGEISLYENDLEEQRFVWSLPDCNGRNPDFKRCSDQEEIKAQKISMADIYQGSDASTLSTVSEDSSLVLVILLDRTLRNFPTVP